MQTILYHAKLYVARGDFRSALCAEDGIIRAVGSDAEILALARPGCRRIDCEGRAVVPGFNDSHIHLMQLAQTRYEAPISGAHSVDELIARCREFLANHPERTESGLHAIGWNQDDFPDGRLPDRHDLDRISRRFPWCWSGSAAILYRPIRWRHSALRPVLNSHSARPTRYCAHLTERSAVSSGATPAIL